LITKTEKFDILLEKYTKIKELREAKKQLEE
jgi:hypothetical protein